MEDQEEINVDSLNMHMFRHSMSSPCLKRQAARKFCFPSGIFVKKINKEQVSVLLNNQALLYSKENTFVFTIDNQDEGASADRFLYCLCVVRDDLLVIVDKNK